MMGYWGWGFPDKPVRKNGKMSDDLTTAYLLGVENMRDKLHKQADEIERLRERLAEADEANRRVSDENEKLRRDVKTAVMGDSAELADVKRENEKLRAALIEECQSSEKENRRKRAYYDEVIAAEKVIAELRDENEKLRFERDTIGESNYVNGWNEAINSSEAMQDVKRENEKLREAFKPFLDKYKWLFLDESSDPTFYADDGITLAQLWAARAAIRESGND